MKEARHKRVHTVGFCLFHAQEHIKLICGIKSWDSGYLWMGLVASDWKGTPVAFWNAGHHILLLKLGAGYTSVFTLHNFIELYIRFVCFLICIILQIKVYMK